MVENLDLGSFMFGIVLTMVVFFFLIVIFEAPKDNTLSALCNQKYGAGNWTSSVQNGYWVCSRSPNTNPVCFLDGIGAKECQNQTTSQTGQ